MKKNTLEKKKTKETQKHPPNFLQKNEIKKSRPLKGFERDIKLRGWIRTVQHGLIQTISHKVVV